ncbi:MAG: peptidase T [Clostridia bacterium]|nr:peptidase T [Clostridia bacterium]
MSSVKERFLRYVQIDTQSEDDVEAVPSTEKQFDLARLLEKELRALGAEDVRLDGHCCLTAAIPASDGRPRPVIGLIAHMDTVDAVSGANVRPVLTPGYDGGDIAMGPGYVLSPRQYPYLARYKGQEIICSDGSTLLGADDKAGVAEIMALAERLLQGKTGPHGRIRIAFTPDEEVGRGVDYFDVKDFGADFAFTVDGGALGDINFENFNAADAAVHIQGVSVHTGTARGLMRNASLLAMELNAMLPPFEDPACTDGYEGFYHLHRVSGCVDHADMLYILRDHDRNRFEERKALFAAAVAYMNRKYGEGTVELRITDTYYNMKEKIDPALVERIKEAMRRSGVEPLPSPIRGGTDGARLSYAGLPCPNICTGGHNFHGRYEFISTEAMEKVVEILENLVCDPSGEG